MTYDRDPIEPPPGMTPEQIRALPVTEGDWRESDRYVCQHCIQNAFHNPYTNSIWGCRECGQRTMAINKHFFSPLNGKTLPDAIADVRNFAEGAIQDDWEYPSETPPEDQLPEFRVTLQRVPPGERAVDPNDRRNQGTRTKLGGLPDWIQLTDETPTCPGCGSKMTFVAQIDSIEHISMANPIGMDLKSRDPTKKPWMFADVGMLYLFYCFACAETRSVTQSY